MRNKMLHKNLALILTIVSVSILFFRNSSFAAEIDCGSSSQTNCGIYFNYVKNVGGVDKLYKWSVAKASSATPPYVAVGTDVSGNNICSIISSDTPVSLVTPAGIRYYDGCYTYLCDVQTRSQGYCGYDRCTGQFYNGCSPNYRCLDTRCTTGGYHPCNENCSGQDITPPGTGSGSGSGSGTGSGTGAGVGTGAGSGSGTGAGVGAGAGSGAGTGTGQAGECGSGRPCQEGFYCLDGSCLVVGGTGSGTGTGTFVPPTCVIDGQEYCSYTGTCEFVCQPGGTGAGVGTGTGGVGGSGAGVGSGSGVGSGTGSGAGSGSGSGVGSGAGTGAGSGSGSGAGAGTGSGITCDPDHTTCPGIGCVDLNSDPNNCGYCGNLCATDNCVNGQCIPDGGEACGQEASCAAGSCCAHSDQGDYCVTSASLQTDVRNCGACDHSCGIFETCVNGQCGGWCGQEPPCGAGYCCVDEGQGGYCKSVQNDPNNCGACGNVCVNGQTCTNGSCQCPNGTALCNGACLNMSCDNNNCGGCGIVCNTRTQYCCNGHCVNNLMQSPCTCISDTGLDS